MALQEVVEMTQNFVHRQVLLKKGTVRALGEFQFLAEEGDGAELIVDLLLEHRAYCFRRDVSGENCRRVGD